MSHIIVVQEIDKNTAFVRDALEPHGHVVTAVREPAQAKELVEKGKVDLVICAVHLNYGDVFEFLMWLKRHPTYGYTPFVFFCAEPSEFAKYVSPVVTSAAKIIGVADHITMDKFDGNIFSDRIHAALGTTQSLSLFQREHLAHHVEREARIVEAAADAFAGARNLAAKKAAQDVG